MHRASQNLVEALERRVQFSACPALTPDATGHTQAAAPASASDIGDPATTPEIEITLEDGTIVPTEPPNSDPTGTSPVIDFGAVVRTQQATAKAFLIKNLGVDPLSVGDITLPNGFVLVQAPPATIAPGESGKVVIGLDTTASGAYVGPVVVASDDPDEPLLSFRISAEVLPPPLSVASIDARRLPAALVAGATQPRRPIAVTLRNETDLPFADSVTITAYASSDATLDAGDAKLADVVTNVRLPAGRARTFRLTLSPDAFPAGDATLIAGVTAADVTDALAGPQFSVRPPFVSLTSGPSTGDPRAATVSAKRGRPVPLRLAITNAGNVPTTLTPATFTVAVSPDGSAANVVASTSVATKLRIAPGQTRQVRLAPTFPADALPAGEYQLRVTISAETNQTNDTFLVTLPVQFA